MVPRGYLTALVTSRGERKGCVGRHRFGGKRLKGGRSQIVLFSLWMLCLVWVEVLDGE